MTSKREEATPPDRLAAAFEAFREAWFSGKPVDIDSFCRDHPECGPALRQEIEDFLYVAERLPHRDQSKDEDSPSDGDSDQAPAGRILGDFRILREIGRGGMGTVYEAEQISLRRKVALKILPAHLSLSKRAVLKFQREAEAGGRQKHPGIVSIFAVGEHKNVHYIAQELIEGGRTLADWLDELRGLPVLPPEYFRKMTRFIARVCDALQHAHESGVIHRDIKPSNILLAADGSPRVTDFGLARLEGALALSRSGDFSGTPYYMSPEQVTRKRIGIDERTDVFSLGVTLYELLTLVRPFEGETSQEVLKKILVNEPRDPRQMNPRVPRDLTVVCLKAMEKEPGQRYPSMAEFGNDLRRILSGDVILAKPSSVGTRARKWVKRNPVLSAAGGVALLALIGFLGYMLLWSYPRIKEERDKALTAEQSAIQAKEEADRERERANQEAERAGKEAAAARAISDFLVGLFDSANPEGAMESDLSVRELLDRGVERIRDGFAEQPEIKGELLYTMGCAYMTLGKLNKAESLLDQALTCLRDVLPDDHHDVLITMSQLAELYRLQGRLDDAEALFEKALEQQRRKFGESHELTKEIMGSLALVYLDQGKYEEGNPLLLDCLEDYRKSGNENDPEAVKTMMSLASSYAEMGLYSEGEAYYTEALSISRQTQGDDHIQTIMTAQGLGSLYLMQGQFDKAEPLCLEAFTWMRLHLEEGSPFLSAARSSMAILYQRQGRFEEAEPILVEDLEINRRILGDEHSYTFTSMVNLAIFFSSLQRYGEAEALLLEAASGMRKALGKDHLLTFKAIHGLATIYKRQGRFEEAEPLYLEAQEGIRRVLGNEHPMLFSTLNQLAGMYMGLGRQVEAETLYKEALDGLRRTHGDTHSETLVTLCNLGNLYLQLGRLDEAEPLCLEGFEGMRAVMGMDNRTTLSALSNLIQVYFKKGQYQKAKPLALDLVNRAPKDSANYPVFKALLDQIREKLGEHESDG